MAEQEVSDPTLSSADETEDLIAELCLSAPSEDIKFCLRNYQYGKTINQLKKEFNYKTNKTILIETAKYLNIPNYDQNKSDLIHLIICRIQNLLPEDCSMCNAKYRMENTEVPVIECAICGQGVHTLCWLQLLNITAEDEDDLIDIKMKRTERK